MATGTADDYPTLITNLIYLERDAIAAYESVIERLESGEYKREIQSFKADHDRHLETLKRLAGTADAEVPSDGDMKQMLTTGRVAMADLTGGDTSIISAMASNEDDTVEAYQNASQNSVVPTADREFFQSALEDEKRHRSWMKSIGDS